MKLLKTLLSLLILCPATLEAGTVSVELDYENHSKGAASKAEGRDLLTRTEALKKETKASYRRIDNLVDSDEPNAGLFMKQAMQKQQDLNQLRGLRKQLKEACKFSKEELESCKVRVKDNEGDDGFQTDSSCEDNMSREDQAFNRGVLKGVGPGMVAALKGSAEGLYHLATSPVATVEGLIEFLENIDEVPGLLAASLEELEGMDPEQQGEEIAKLIADQVFTFAVPTSKVKVLQQASKAKLGAAAVKVGKKGIKGIKLGEYTITKSVAKNITTRPYINSPSTIANIMKSSKGVPDSYFKGGMNYKMQGAFNGANGIFELGINPETNTIYHFLFKTIK